MGGGAGGGGEKDGGLVKDKGGGWCRDGGSVEERMECVGMWMVWFGYCFMSTDTEAY
jgi:hypothetical protein